MIFTRAMLVYTPATGKKRKIKKSGRLASLISKISKETPLFFETQSVEDTHSFIFRCLSNKEVDVILVAGGDGLVSSVCNALMKLPKDLRVPFLPLAMGSGNTFADDVNIKSAKDAIRLIEKSKSTSCIDVLKVTAGKDIFYCVNLLGGGFITDVTKSAAESGKKIGAFSYIVAVIKLLRKLKNYEVRFLDRDSKVISQSSKAVLISFNNNCKTGAAFKMAPNALINDGLFDVVILHDISLLEFFIGFLKLFSGKHIYCRGCEYFQTDYIKVETKPDMALMRDGELSGNSPFEVEILKNELTIALELNA